MRVRNLVIILTLLLLFSSLLVFIYLQFLVPSKKQPIPSTKETIDEYIDILSFPSWTGFPGVARTEEGSMAITTLGGTELLVRNSNDFVEVGPNGFEVMTRIRTVASSNVPRPIPVRGSLALYNKSPNQRDALQLEIGLTNSNYLWLRFVDMEKELPEEKVKIYFAPSEGYQIEKVKTNDLKISFTRQGGEEFLNIYDGTGEIIAEDIRLPRPFFSEDSNQLYFGFYPVSGSDTQVATMTVEYLKIKNL